MSLADNIKKFRELRNIKVQQLADKIGAKKQSVYDWEKGKYAPGPDNLDLLAKALDVEIKDFYGDGNLNEKQEKMNVMDISESIQKETWYAELIEKNEVYALIPKTVLRDYKMVPDKVIDIITKSNEGEKEAIIARYRGEKDALEAKHALIIATLENRSTKLEEDVLRLKAEKEELQRQIASKGK